MLNERVRPATRVWLLSDTAALCAPVPAGAQSAIAGTVKDAAARSCRA